MVPSFRVMIADDHPIVRHGLQAVLESSPLIELIAVATSFRDVLDQLRHHDPSWITTLVLDLSGMHGSPIAFVETLHRTYPQIALIVFSSLIDFAPELLDRGVHGYISKEELTTHLIDAIMAGRSTPFISPIVQAYLDRATSTERKLTPTELSVLKMLDQGLTTTALADQLGVDPRTAQNYITSLRRKLNCQQRTQLVAWYQQMYGSGS